MERKMNMKSAEEVVEIVWEKDWLIKLRSRVPDLLVEEALELWQRELLRSVWGGRVSLPSQFCVRGLTYHRLPRRRCCYNCINSEFKVKWVDLKGLNAPGQCFFKQGEPKVVYGINFCPHHYNGRSIGFFERFTYSDMANETWRDKESEV
jgi:hypothetical protein